MKPDLKKIAQLARLKLTDVEISEYAEQIERILGYVDSISKVDVIREGTAVTPLYHPWASDFLSGTPLREDRVVEFEAAPGNVLKVMSNATGAVNDGYQVPPVL